jgi:hypothetical protein
MATAAKSAMDEFSFNGEAVGVAGASALRKIRPLIESAPPGRLFASIATLADTSGKAAQEFEAAGLATLRQETAEAESRLNRGIRFVHQLKTVLGAEVATPLPEFMRRK